MSVKGKPADMQPIPKGKPERKQSEKEVKAKKDKEARLAKAAQPEQYSARVVNGIVSDLKTQGARVWKDLKEKEQTAIIGLIQNRVENELRQIVQDLAGQGHPAIPVKLQSIKFKAGVDIAIQAPTATKACHIASEKIGGAAVLVLVDPAIYIGGEMPVADKDQPDLNLPQPESAAYEEFDDPMDDEGESDDE